MTADTSNANQRICSKKRHPDVEGVESDKGRHCNAARTSYLFLPVGTYILLPPPSNGLLNLYRGNKVKRAVFTKNIRQYKSTIHFHVVSETSWDNT